MSLAVPPSGPHASPLDAVLTLSELAPGGEAVGRRDDGLVVFVPGGAPGEQVEVRLEEVKKGYARARLLRVLSPSVERVEPACPLARPDRCGGCPLMHVGLASQLRAKEAWVRRALRKSGAEVLPIVAPASELGYRVRARLTVRDGQLGFVGARSHRVVAVERCPVLDPRLENALLTRGRELVPLLGEGAVLAGLVGRTEGAPGRPAQPAVQLWARLGRAGDRRAVRAWLKARVHEGLLAGARLTERNEDEGEVLGAPALDIGSEEPAGMPLLASAEGFAQASAPGHSLLPELVASALAGERPRIVELYAGSGNLTRALRRVASSVLAIEGDASACNRLRRMAEQHTGPGLAPLTVRHAPVEKGLLELQRAGVECDALVLDPPRTGALDVLRGIAALLPRRVVYVSCDAMTLGRDLQQLRELGLVPKQVQPLDLMPQTAEVECVAVLDAAPDRRPSADRSSSDR